MGLFDTFFDILCHEVVVNAATCQLLEVHFWRFLSSVFLSPLLDS